jgi:TDG/mug DNA glycosylase family protein
MIKYKISYKPLILFVGINPHNGSYRRGVPFSNNKTLWYLLNRSGLINEKIDDLREDGNLKKFYEEKFMQKYNYNFINIIERPTRDTSLLEKGEEKKGVRKIAGIISRNKPKIVCFIGKVTYARFSGKNDFRLGFQEDIGNAKVFVASFPIRGAAIVRIREFRRIARALNV